MTWVHLANSMQVALSYILLCDNNPYETVSSVSSISSISSGSSTPLFPLIDVLNASIAIVCFVRSDSTLSSLSGSIHYFN